MARERRGLSLATIARQWGVREQNLLLIEQDAFESLPTGLYGRNAVRAYASAVGVPADEALAEIVERLPVPEDPMAGLARVRGLTWTAARKSTAAPEKLPAKAAASANGAGPEASWRCLAAAAIDGAVLIGIELTLIGLTSLAAGVGPTQVMRVAAPAMILLGAIIGAVYFVLLGGIRRQTIGARVAQAPADAAMLEGGDVHTVIQRSLRCVLAEGSSFVNWISSQETAWQWVRTLRVRRA
jgi:hypothetical protein